jgi:signal transduction histidine kinase
MGALRVTARVTPTRISGDLHQVSQVVRNLVDNASQHANSKLGFVLESADSFAVLDIYDDGPGIPAPDRERIFDRFVRLDSSRQRASGGNGLGLAIVREIVVAHGGTVAVVDEPGGGARFRVRLPSQPPSSASR